MRFLLACALSLFLLRPGYGQTPELAQARQRWLHGNYSEAQEAYERLAASPATALPATLGLSRALESLGEYDRALQVIDALLKSQPEAAPLLARRAELLYFRGKTAEAEQTANQALAKNANDFLARWVRSQVANDRADLKAADTDFRWFVRTYTDRSNKDDDIKDPDELLIVAQAGTENARWHNLSDQYRVILTDVLGDALRNEKNYWPAECFAGRLLLEKYNRGEALDAFDKALSINPNAAEALVGKGEAALQRYEIKDAEQLADRALRINPRLPEALRLRADIAFHAGSLAKARQFLERALEVNPIDERTLAGLATYCLLTKDTQRFDSIRKEVQARDPKPGLFCFELAQRLEERKLYETAEKYYREASELRPMLPGPRNGLGLLFMRLGQEKDAKDLLTKAFARDEFNVRVSNALKVLRHLEHYETLTTEHFILKFDPQTDRRLARYMAPYLENIYSELAVTFQYRPPGPILVEVFNNHEMFSGRVVSLPDLHTIGACTGRVLALVSPAGAGVRKPFNWARVLRHELVHIFNLEQTQFQVPHWFTEGLAVGNEGFPRPQTWNHLLMERVPSGDLLNLKTIDLGFIRPRSPVEWNLAYCQSQIYVDYLKEKFGTSAVGTMLKAYAEGLDTAAALKQTCKTEVASFEEGYRAHLQEVVKTLRGRPPEKPLTFIQLQRAHEEDPKNRDLSARLAEQLLLRREQKESRRLVEAVLAEEPTHALALYVKARLLMAAGDDDQALTLLKSALDRNAPEPRILRALGKIYYEASDFAKAGDIYELAHQAEPYESRWLVELARVYVRTGDKTKRIEVLKKLVETDPDDLEQRKKLAELLLEAGRNAEAERYARQTLEIDVRDGEGAELLQKALRAQGRAAEAEQLQRLLEGK